MTSTLPNRPQCVVLGNGPSLQTDRIPRNTNLIGVNRSYEVIYAPIWCTVDYVAFETAFNHWQDGTYHVPQTIYCRETAVNRTSTPKLPPQTVVVKKFRGNSGLFALNVAMDLGYERIYLLGFDSWSTDNFYGPNREKDLDGLKHARKTQRKALWKLRDDARLWIWRSAKRNGGFRPLSEVIEWDQVGQKLS